MADPTFGAGAEDGPGTGPVIRDRRRIDPETGRVREACSAPAGPDPGSPAGADPAAANGRVGTVGPGAAAAESVVPESGPGGAGTGDPDPGHVVDPATGNEPAGRLAADLAAARAVAEERLSDLQRLQAEYVNYRRRVERDRDVARDVAVAGVLEALLPVLDDVHLARQHGDLESGPFAAIVDKLEATLARLGLSRYGESGETFDPTVHEALMHAQVELAEGTTEPTVVQVLQPGYRVGERVLRAARVAVADPQ